MEVSVDFIKRLKKHILHSRYIVAKIANAESLQLYYNIGKELEKELSAGEWGAGVMDSISKRLQAELAGLRGFSASNLKKMRIFFNAWDESIAIGSLLTNQFNGKTIEKSSLATNQLEHAKNKGVGVYSTVTSKLGKDDSETLPTVSAKLDDEQIDAFFSTPFSHHYEIILKTDAEQERWYYIFKTAQNFWTVRHLRTELVNKSHLQEAQMPSNFERTMPQELSNKAMRAFKDQYLLDFVNVEDADDEIDERLLETEIVQNIRKFLMSLGTDFTFMGNQYRLIVDEDEYFIDLLFYHRSLQSLVAFELKKGKFKPEYVGKMNFYLSALDDMVKQPHENPSIGIILCKEKENKKVEYSFRDFSKPMGVAVYKTTETLPPQLKDALPDAETLKKLMD